MSGYTGQVPETRRPVDWREWAACKEDPDVMFPDNNTHGIEQARRVCRPCPVRQQCLADAIRTGEDEYGIRAGLKPSERRAIVKRRRLQGAARTTG